MLKEAILKYSFVFNILDDNKIEFKILILDKKSDLKTDFKDFSLSLKKIFKLASKSFIFKNQNDFEKVLNLVGSFGFKIFFKKDKNIFEVVKKDTAKLKVEFFLKDDFYLKLDDKIRIYFWFGDTFYFIKNEWLSKIDFNGKKVAKNIFNRILKKKIDLAKYSNEFKTRIFDKEIFELNNILDFFQKNFDFQKKYFYTKFSFEEYKKLGGFLNIFYDKKKENLKIFPVFRYGNIQINLSREIKNYILKNERVFVFQNEKEYYFFVKESKIFWFKRDFKKELEFYKKIYSERREYGLNSKMFLERTGEKKISLFLAKYWRKYNENFEKVFYEKDEISLNSSDIKFKFNIRKGPQGELGLVAEIKINDEKLNFDELKKIKNNQEYRKDGKIIEIKNKSEVKRLIEILNKFEEVETNSFKLKEYQVFDLENISDKINEDNRGFNFKEKIKNIFKDRKKISKLNIKLNDRYKKILRPYQFEGVEWMYFLRKYYFGGILADDMGLGKTIQFLVFLESLKEKKELLNKSLVIAPKSVIRNWEEEARKFTPNLRVLVVDGDIEERKEKISKISDYDLIITSYTIFNRDFEFYEKEKFEYLVLDEAQYIKNFKTKNSYFVKKIKSKYRLALSGTPLENSLAEIWSIFDFLMPSFLASYKNFKEEYLNKIEKGDEKVLKNLQLVLSNFILRREKKDVLKDLPEKIEQNLYLDLSRDQEVLYLEILDKIKKEYKNLDEKEYKKVYFNILASLTKLRQVANHPNLVLKDNDYKKYKSSKLDLFLNLIDELLAEGRKVLVFSQFTKMLDILEEEIKIKKIKYSRLDGSSKDREKIVSDFNQNNDKKIFLISLKAGGVGLNLTSADTVIIFDPWWNPFVERQAIDRSHRMGQKKVVNVYRLISRNTIEEKILKLQEKKKDLFDNLLEKKNSSIGKINWDDIKEILDIE